MELQERVMALEQRLKDLEAREAIREIMGHYAHGLDCEDWDELESIFADDVVMESKPSRPYPVKGRDNYMALSREHRANMKHTRRHIANEQITIEGDSAKAQAYGFYILAHGGQSYIGFATYDWDFRLEKDAWKITYMKVTIHTMTTLERGWGMDEKRVLTFPYEMKFGVKPQD